MCLFPIGYGLTLQSYSLGKSEKNWCTGSRGRGESHCSKERRAIASGYQTPRIGIVLLSKQTFYGGGGGGG